MPEGLDGVACEPGSMIKQPDGTLWICDKLGFKYHKTVEGTLVKEPESLVATGTPPAVDPLWIIFWMAVVFVLGSLGVGLTQWWRNRKARRTADLEVWNKLMVPELKQAAVENLPKSALDKLALGITPEGDIQMAEVTKTSPTPQQLMMDLREAFMQVQLARGEINKIPGMVQVYVNGAMQHLDKARDIVSKACAEVGTLKVQP